MPLRSRLVPRFVLVLLLVAAPVISAAQSLSGHVTDDTGLAIPGASVRIVNEATRAALDVVTDADGRYEAVLVPGAYRVEAYLHAYGRERTWILSNPIYL